MEFRGLRLGFPANVSKAPADITSCASAYFATSQKCVPAFPLMLPYGQIGAINNGTNIPFLLQFRFQIVLTGSTSQPISMR